MTTKYSFLIAYMKVLEFTLFVILLMFSIYYSIKEQDKDLNQVLFDDSYMNINNSWISITIGIFPVSFAAIDITASSISTRNLAGVENVIIILLIMFLLVSRDVLLKKEY